MKKSLFACAEAIISLMRKFYLIIFLVCLSILASACSSSQRLIVKEADQVSTGKGPESFRFQSLLYLKQYCATEEFPKGPEPECDERAIDARIAEYRKKYEVSPGIVVLPEGKEMGLFAKRMKVQDGVQYEQVGSQVVAKPRYRYENTGTMRICAHVFNFTERPLRKVSLRISAFDKTGAKLVSGTGTTDGPLFIRDPGVYSEISWFRGLIIIIPLIWPRAHILYSLKSENALACTEEGFAVTPKDVGSLGFEVLSVENP